MQLNWIICTDWAKSLISSRTPWIYLVIKFHQNLSRRSDDIVITKFQWCNLINMHWFTLKYSQFNNALNWALISNFIRMSSSKSIHRSLPILIKRRKCISCPKEVSNYRQISVLSNTHMLFERIIYNKLNLFLVSLCLLTPRNAGFKQSNQPPTNL